jgi:putative DNA primase/helicase
MSTTAAPRQNWFAEYATHGWRLCRIELGTKGPNFTGWNEDQNAITSPESAGKLRAAGLLHAYSKTCAFDIDNLTRTLALIPEIADWFLDPAMVRIESGNPNHAKFLFALLEPLPSKSFYEGAFELRCSSGTGRTVQDVLPPSPHPSGTTYKWASGDWRNLPPLPDVLREMWMAEIHENLHIHNVVNKPDSVNNEPASQHMIDAALEWLSRQPPAVQGAHGDSQTYKVCAKLVRDFGLSEEQAFEVMRPWDAECQPPWGEELKVKIHNAKDYGTRPVGADDPTQDFEAIKEEQEPTWPTPEPLQGTLPPVKPFKAEMLPESLRANAVDVAERMSVPLDFTAAASVCCLAGAVNRRARIQPKALDDSWQEVPNLWGAMIAPPGSMKTPMMNTATYPLRKIEHILYSQYKVALDFYENTEDKKSLVDKPRLQRLIVNDATAEKLHEVMSENPAGIFVVRDELTGWLADFEKKDRKSERAFYLAAWSGDTGYTMDRMSRGTIRADACCASMFGGIQPERLRSCLVDAGVDDGLIQRFQVLVYPDSLAQAQYVDRPPNKEAAERVERIFNELVNLDAKNPELYRFAADAQKLFVDWLTALDKRLLNEDSPALISHLKKYRGLMPSLAVLFELVDRAASGNLTKGDKLVSLEHTRQAVAWCDYLESHARRVYSCQMSMEDTDALKLAGAIKNGKLEAKFTFRDVLRSVRSLRKATALKALKILKDAGWIRSAGSVMPEGGGPASELYEVNPQVMKMTA